MNLALPDDKRHRFGLIVLMAWLIIGISSLTRFALLIKSISQADLTLIQLAGAFAIGLFFDVIQATYFTLPFALYLLLIPQTIYEKNWHRVVLYGLVFMQLFLLLFNAIAEWFFWDEFSSRFNFIAVDYLVYTTEVIGNIRQSYPIEWIMVALVIISLLFTYLIKSRIDQSMKRPMRLKKRLVWGGSILLLPLLSFAFVTNNYRNFSSNSIANELAGNGLYELFAAYRNNELNYDQFYPHLSEKDAHFNLERILLPSVPLSSTLSLERIVTHAGEEKKLNVVLISIESFSAEYLSLFGNTQRLTPFLDSLAQQSLTFTNLYATGTRTVRGLEALSLAIPPTPGQSIVRRPQNENLFSLATVFNTKGYESKFIYGGYSYFDNMGYFFEHNNYQVIDRSSLADEEIDYENIWGVADENLFTLALREIDETTQQNQLSFSHIMTTTNHRPFTYPDGRINIPSHTNREGAVKYTDYAIGKFIKEASTKNWYSNTIFIITADHCASSAGKTELPIKKYQIPMLIFSPAHVPPGVQDRLMSQIDIAPTLLGILNFSYQTKFFGYDIETVPQGKERAFISTYQLLGYIKNDSLVILAPKKEPMVYLTNQTEESVVVVEKRKHRLSIVTEAITWYQEASYAFKNQLMND